jgi:hypothetical protein
MVKELKYGQIVKISNSFELEKMRGMIGKVIAKPKAYSSYLIQFSVDNKSIRSLHYGDGASLLWGEKSNKMNSYFILPKFLEVVGHDDLSISFDL